MRLALTVRGVDHAATHVIGIGERAVDARPAFEVIARDLMSDERRRFDSDGFGTWPKLDPDTIRRKRARNLSEQTLQATGALRRALTQKSAPGQRLEIGRSQMRFGLQPSGAAYYGKFHQQGKGVPKRLVIAVTPRQRTQITSKVRAFIVHADT